MCTSITSIDTTYICITWNIFLFLFFKLAFVQFMWITQQHNVCPYTEEHVSHRAIIHVKFAVLVGSVAVTRIYRSFLSVWFFVCFFTSDWLCSIPFSGQCFCFHYDDAVVTNTACVNNTERKSPFCVTLSGSVYS